MKHTAIGSFFIFVHCKPWDSSSLHSQESGEVEQILRSYCYRLRDAFIMVPHHALHSDFDREIVEWRINWQGLFLDLGVSRFNHMDDCALLGGIH